MSNTYFNNSSENDLEYDNNDTVKDGYMEGDVEFDEEVFGSAEYLYDLAATTETAIALGSSLPNANLEAFDNTFPAFNGCMKLLSEGKDLLRPTKPVRFTDVDVTFSLDAPTSAPVQSNVDTRRGVENNQTAAGDAKSQPLALQPRTKQEFYRADSNLWMVQLHVGRVGNYNVHIGFRVESMYVLWDLTRTPDLRGFLHEQGATVALLNVFQQFCPQESVGRVVDAQGRVLLKVLDVCPSQWCEEEQMRALALLSLANLAQETRREVADSVKEAIIGASPALFEQLVDLCGRYITNCGNRSLYSLDRSIGGAMGSALAPYNLAREAQGLLTRIYSELQQTLGDIAREKVVCCGGPACLPATVEACAALHRKFESLTAVNINEARASSTVKRHEYIRSERIVVC